MFKLKKIDTESKGYIAIREGISFVASAGSGWAFEAMSIPWVAAVFQKHRFMRYVSYLGVIPLAVKAADIGEEVTKRSIDDCVFLWNVLADKVNGEEDDIPEDDIPEDEDFGIEVKTEKYYHGIKVPGFFYTPAEQREFIDALVRKTAIFEFKTEEVAKRCVELLHEKAEANKFVTISDALFLREGFIAPDAVREHTDLWGWKADMFSGVPIDKISDDHWIANLFGYMWVGDLYHVLDDDNKEE